METFAQSFGIVLPLWSYAADDGRLLDHVAGEVGLDHVTVPVVAGAASQFRLAEGYEKPYFQTEGGWHFPPTAKLYTASGVRPTKARWFGSADHLRACGSTSNAWALGWCFGSTSGPSSRSWNRNRSLASAMPGGRKFPRRALRLQSARARAAAGHTRRSAPLRAGRVRARGLDARLRGGLGDGTAPELAPRGPPVARYLLLSRVPADCRARGADPDQAARSVRVCVEQQAAAAPEAQDAAPHDPVVLQYAAARVADCALWLRQLAEADADHRYQLIHAFETPLPYVPPPLEELARLSDRALAAVEPDGLSSLLRCAGIVGWALPVWRPSFTAPATLVRLVSDAVANGVRLFDFEGLDEAPSEAVTWLKQAVRLRGGGRASVRPLTHVRQSRALGVRSGHWPMWSIAECGRCGCDGAWSSC